MSPPSVLRNATIVFNTMVFYKFMVRVFTKALWLDSPSAK